MAAKEAPAITDPSQIQESDLSLGLSLHLLQPLATPTMLAACRSPASRVVPTQDDRPSGSIGDEFIGDEFLDISALGKAWRQALAKVQPISRLTFNLSLPKPANLGEGEGEDAFHKVYWHTSMPADGHHLAVVAPEVMRLVITIATTTRVRLQGDVHFEIVFDEDDGVSLMAMELLKKELRAAVAEFKGKAPAPETAGGGADGNRY